MRTTALLLCASLLSGCATAGRYGLQGRPSASRIEPSPQLLAEYVKGLPVGSRVKVDASDGRHIKGTLMKTTETTIVVQPRTRVPESPVEIQLAQVLAVEPETGNSVGKTFGVAFAAGAAGTLAVLLILFAAWGGD